MITPVHSKLAAGRVLIALATWLAEHPYPPTVRELARQAAMRSFGTVAAYLADLEAAGLVTRELRRPRTLQITEAGRAWLERYGPGRSNCST
jgi:repressor LexA